MCFDAPILDTLRLRAPLGVPLPGVADSATVTEPNYLRLALAHVLSERFDAGLARGTKRELGALVSPESATVDAASVAASRLLAGECAWPDKMWAEIAEFVGLTPAGLLREVAAIVDRMAKEPEFTRPPKRRRGKPPKRQ